MTELQKTILIYVLPAILGSRLWSMIEHRATKKRVDKTNHEVKTASEDIKREVLEIKVSVNGELEKRIAAMELWSANVKQYFLTFPQK